MTELVTNAITCPKCQSRLNSTAFDSSDFSCPHCNLIITGRLFPRFFKPYEEVKKAGEISSDKESSCFFHPNKKAVTHCSECGRFLCSLCELDIEGRIICPSCLEKLDNEKKVETFTNHTTFWDSLTLSLSIMPLLFCPITIITAPLTMFYIWKHFNCTKDYLIPRTRFRFYIAGLLALTQIGVWGYVITMAII